VPEEEVKGPSNRIARFAMLNVQMRIIAVVAGITYAGNVTKANHLESTNYLITKKCSQLYDKGYYHIVTLALSRYKFPKPFLRRQHYRSNIIFLIALCCLVLILKWAKPYLVSDIILLKVFSLAALS
jgi:glucan phosphoethanolaminetransferase (alkaline phosphatase superfamily)